MRDGYTIGQLASYSGVTIDTVRVYERQGLIKAPERRSNGYRHYSKDYVKRINFIKWAQTLGFTLKEIKKLLTIYHSSTHACEEILCQLETKLNIVESRVKELLRFESVLKSTIQTCNKTMGEHCPVMEALDKMEQCSSECTPLVENFSK
jgi:MerR family Zn(II)-responsive transcriptional regulator of zntA